MFSVGFQEYGLYGQSMNWNPSALSFTTGKTFYESEEEYLRIKRERTRLRVQAHRARKKAMIEQAKLTLSNQHQQ